MHNRMKNPHLRAKLAEVLEAVMPHMETVASGAAQPLVFQRERVFSSYRHAPQLAESLIAVFVDIEFTGIVFLTRLELRLVVDGSSIVCSTLLEKAIFIYCSVHPGEGFLLCCSPEGFFTFFPWKGFFYCLGSFSWSDVRSKVRDVVCVQTVKPFEAHF